MKNYSINYLNAAGLTQTSELRPFENNQDAVDFACIGLLRSAIVEVWKDTDLVERLFGDLPAAPGATAGASNQATRGSYRAGTRSSLEGWDNEGGATVRSGGGRR
jgi:hypothetical protein